MRMKKKTIWGNDQLLPGYNIRFGVCDEYIAVYDVEQYASDMDCFKPLMEKFPTEYMESILNIQLPTQAMEASTTICTAKNTEWENT